MKAMNAEAESCGDVRGATQLAVRPLLCWQHSKQTLMVL